MASEGLKQDIKEYKSEDPLHLQNSDHLGMILVTALLTGTNYNSWSRSIRIALGAKSKLGFIDGSCPKPNEFSNDIQ